MRNATLLHAAIKFHIAILQKISPYMQEKIQNISPIKQRILQLIDTMGISKRDFYSKTGISRGTLESKTGITEDTLAKFIATYGEISIEWLILGEGSVYKNQTNKSISIDSTINDHNMTMIRLLMDQLGEKNEEIGRLKEKIAGLIEELKEAREVAARSAPDSHSAAG